MTKKSLSIHNSAHSERLRKKRYRAEKRFKLYGIFALSSAILALIILISDIAIKSKNAFLQTQIQLEFFFDSEILILDNIDISDRSSLNKIKFNPIVKQAINDEISSLGLNDHTYRDFKPLISRRGVREDLKDFVQDNPLFIGKTEKIWVTASDDVDQYVKSGMPDELVRETRKFKKKQTLLVKQLYQEGKVRQVLNINFFTSGDSSAPELAGIWGALIGSLFTMLITLVFAFPIAVCAGIYLEEFAPKNGFTDIIEVNINNLAAVPSIIFGLLGLVIFIQTFGLPRSAPLVGGMVLALMTLPTIIIATRVSLKSIPYSIREAALGVGASPLQAVMHHVLPLATPGILTGTIIGMARALGETAPLIMIGMVAFIVDIPQGFSDNATALPVQIFLWADKPERGFVAKTAAAILVLLTFLIIMNAAAIALRKRYEKRW